MADDQQTPATQEPAQEPSNSASQEPSTTEPVDQPLGEAGEKALEAMKARAREAEKKLRAHEAELEKLRNAAMSEQEKAVAEAEERGRMAALTETGKKLAAAELRAVAASRGIAPDALQTQIEFLDLGAFLGEDGDVDSDRVTRFVEAIPSAKSSIPGVPAGARITAPEPTLADMIAEAKANGDTKRFIALQNAQLPAARPTP